MNQQFGQSATPSRRGRDSGAMVPASQPVMMRALRWGLLSTSILMVAAGVVGYLITGIPGLTAGVIGAIFAGLFVGFTAGSIAFANRFIDRDFYIPAFFGIVMGSWVLKFLVFLVAAFLLRDQPWLSPRVMFVTIILGVLISLGVDMWIMMTSRIPTVSDLVLREHEAENERKSSEEAN